MTPTRHHHRVVYLWACSPEVSDAFMPPADERANGHAEATGHGTDAS
jgi:hypothetical protein